ncbi:energy transducer TonB [Thiocapsa roseopersicina]|uniref:Protein TonB n=1 Tax=Thiocapsa roseopersicina TaxID=1058 RepID=A0A1H2WP67_THIRO|nr:energy transducer TonB [Thiocapsa roseopersicina]SDW82288.1 outer membrane transport energization protein TonB [Thiocapsa roseopersicina]
MMEPRRYQWVLALLFALAAHLVLAKLLEPPAPIELDDPGIRISLGGAGPAGDGAAGAVESIAAEVVPAATSEATAIQAVSAPAIAPTLATATETIRAAEPAPPAPITAVEPVRPKPKADPVRSRETPPPRTARAAPKPKPETGSKTTKPRSTSAKTASVDANTGGKPGAGGKGAAAGAEGGGTAGKGDGGKSKDRYYTELAAWLERHKRYPSQARKMRQEGIVRVRFVIDRSGKVISHRIETSSGHTALDHAASELLRRASPMPAIPASMGRSRLEIVVPIAYRLR